MTQRYVLVFFIWGLEVLLGIKTRKILVGFYNGHGGKYEPGESFFEAVKRECFVECGLEPTDENIQPSSILTVEHQKPDGLLEIQIVDIVRVYEFSGKVIDSEEMIGNHWFKIHNLPNEGLHPEKSAWIKDFLLGKDFNITIEYDSNDNIIRNQIEIWSWLF
jgi:8-oxo-dGTP diphosphatase